MYCFYVNILEFSQYLISIFIIDCIFKRIQKFLFFNLKMTVERSKRRFLTLTFIVKIEVTNLEFWCGIILVMVSNLGLWTWTFFRKIII